MSSSAVLSLLPPSFSKNSNVSLKSFFCCSEEERGLEDDAEEAAGKPKSSKPQSAAAAVEAVRRMAFYFWKRESAFETLLMEAASRGLIKKFDESESVKLS